MRKFKHIKQFSAMLINKMNEDYQHDVAIIKKKKVSNCTKTLPTHTTIKISEYRAIVNNFGNDNSVVT